MAEFDLTSKITPNLDRHLVFYLIEFLSQKDIYKKNSVLQVKYDFLMKTNMIDYACEFHKSLYPDEPIPDELKSRRAEIISQLTELQEECDPINHIMTDEDVMKKMETLRDSKALLNYLTKEHKFKIENMETLYKLAKYRYECGSYVVCSSYLYFYTLVMPPTDKNFLNVLWGKLYSEILMQNLDNAFDDLNKLREYIDTNPFGSSLQILQQRTSLIHCSLFIFFNIEKGKELLIEMFLHKPHYLNAIETLCPHILRYLATAVIITRIRRSDLNDLLKVIQQEGYMYKDPITEFLERLYVNFDFEGARRKLLECQTVLSNDFFLINCIDEFIENARLMIFETFCRINQCISISTLAEKLNMNQKEAEYWIVNLIRDARLDAKIDLKLGHVVMDHQPLSPYHQLVEKIDVLTVRTEALQNLLERKNKTTKDIRWGGQEF